jgi:Arf-GAP/GTPase/ANK repeat/PH domain-containing protein 1/3
MFFFTYNLLTVQVRSLDLDEWPPGHLAVMAGLGNQLANSVWEARILPPYRKPGPDSPRWELDSYEKCQEGY